MTKQAQSGKLERVMAHAELKRVEVPGGSLAYEDSKGDGEAVLCLPSLGDLRHEYRFLAPALLDAGYRVLVADLRGHGESSTGFDVYTPEALGQDIIALLDHAGIQAAYLIGCSVSAAAIASVAIEAPERVKKLAMLGGIVRDLPADKYFRPMSHILFMPPWGASLWTMYFKSLFPTYPPADLPEYLAQLKANLKEPGRLRAVGRLARATKEGIFARLSEIKVDTLILIGTKDPDFSDAAAEPGIVKAALGGPVCALSVQDLGHYPHAEAPEQTAQQVIDFLARDPQKAHEEEPMNAS